MKKVGVIGWPVTHSISPAMHNAAFQALGLADWQYDKVPVPPDIVGKALRTLRDEGGYVGVNVTVPLKEKVLPYVQADARARVIGAVNVIDLERGTGSNTDVQGFISDLDAHDITLSGQRVVVLGAGGAARAAVYGLVEARAQVTVVNRTKERAGTMLAEMTLAGGSAFNQVAVRTLDDAAEQPIDLLVNCTSVGLWPNVDETPWIDGVPFPRGVVVYDMIYRPAQTALMQQAEAHGGRAIGGLGMLVRQGAAAFTLWTGHEAPLDVMFEAARTALRG